MDEREVWGTGKNVNKDMETGMPRVGLDSSVTAGHGGNDDIDRLSRCINSLIQKAEKD